MRVLVTLLTALLIFAGYIVDTERARAACSAPSFSAPPPPQPPGTFSRPKMPSCVATQRLTGRDACPRNVFKKYQEDANRYVRRLQAYVNNAQAFANQALKFARGAGAYARCEVDEMNNQ